MQNVWIQAFEQFRSCSTILALEIPFPQNRHNYCTIFYMYVAKSFIQAYRIPWLFNLVDLSCNFQRATAVSCSFILCSNFSIFPSILTSNSSIFQYMPPNPVTPTRTTLSNEPQSTTVVLVASCVCRQSDGRICHLLANFSHFFCGPSIDIIGKTIPCLLFQVYNILNGRSGPSALYNEMDSRDFIAHQHWNSSHFRNQCSPIHNEDSFFFFIFS